ncbi:MAG: GIY-YIG nuclease family protein [Dehalococcoidia bacterium]
MTERGTYALLVFLKDGLRLRIGRLGVHDFPQGYYVYAGSALGGLSGRLKRHLKPEKRLRWHIDYLLQHAVISQIWYVQSGERLECTWNSLVFALPGAKPSLKGFGSSDCRCTTHLTYFSTAPSFDIFDRKLQENGLPPAQRDTKQIVVT